MRRVLVTGSRFWVWSAEVWQALNEQAEEHGDLIVVHGDAPGADHLAHLWCGFSGAHEERHPANWERGCDRHCYHRPRSRNGKPYCPMAGHLRNQEMVDLGADVCLAFPLSDSRGTRDCMKRATAAGIPVIVKERT